jgi:ribosome-associated protein
MIIAIDKAQKEGKHDLKHNQLISMGHELIYLPLPVGDYIIVDDTIREIIKRRGDKLKKMDLIGAIKRSCDSKAHMNEVYQNLIGKSHERFRDECILAQQNNIRLTVLVESAPEVACLEDVKHWKNWKQIYAYCKRHGIKTGQGMLDRIEDFVSHGGQKPPVDGEQLHKAMRTSAEKYGYRWAFTSPENCGKAIIYLLTR